MKQTIFNDYIISYMFIIVNKNIHNTLLYIKFDNFDN